MTRDAMERLARDYMTAFRTRDEAWWDQHIAPDYVRHDPGLDIEVRGVPGMRRLATMLAEAFSDLELPVEDVVVERDKVLLRIRMRGIQTGAFGDLPPTGERFDVAAMDLFHIVDGRIVEQWAMMDRAGFTAQVCDGDEDQGD